MFIIIQGPAAKVGEPSVQKEGKKEEPNFGYNETSNGCIEIQNDSKAI